MNSYAIYRIAETLRVLFFMTLAILVFNFYPLTAVMIVMLALLNDGAILSIAYDNVHYKDKPEAWNMRLVLGISTVLGVIGVVAAFGLFYLGERVFQIRPPAHPDADVSEIVRGRASDDFPDPHPRPVLVHQTREDSLDRRARHANHRDADRGLWRVHDTARLGLGSCSSGAMLWRGSCERPRETAGLSDLRSDQGIFNRSYYEEVLVVRVHPEILRSQGLPEELRDEKTIWKERYRSIVDLEEPPLSQRHADRQNLPPPFEGRTAEAIPRAH
jgi:hypothetical protein